MIRPILIAMLAIPAVALSAPIGDMGKGQIVASGLCATCHGAEGNSTLAMNPNLAGQHPEYIHKQLSDFKTGKRSNPIMMGMVAALSEDDMRNVAAYYAAQKPARLTARDKDLAARGQRLFRGGDSARGVASCSGCHSPNGAGMPAQYPRLAGQHAEYTAAQLRAFRAEERNNDESMMMRSIASRLSDKEIAALSEYLAGLR